MDQLELLRCGAPGGDRAASSGGVARRLVPVMDASAATDDVLPVLVEAGAEAIAIIGCRDAPAASAFAARLAVAEAVASRKAGSVAMIVVVDQPGLATGLALLGAARPRLAALAFDPGRLSRRLGVSEQAAPVATARGLVSLTAAALNLPALLFSRDEAAALADGYGGLLVPTS